MSEPSGPLALVIEAQPRSIGAFAVSRALPVRARRAVGPFVFLDHMGPMTFAPGEGFDVKPHPHIGLSTVTYLFEGSCVHRDSLGTVQEIRPGAINLMTAGRGVVHLLVVAPGAELSLVAQGAAHLVVLGGPPLAGKRFIDWNFVSSSRERIDQAREAWRAQTFPRIPGDDQEYVPLPETAGPHP